MASRPGLPDHWNLERALCAFQAQTIESAEIKEKYNNKLRVMSKKTRNIVDKSTFSGEKPAPAEKPVSLHPLKFEEAVKDLLRVKPRPKTDKDS